MGRMIDFIKSFFTFAETAREKKIEIKLEKLKQLVLNSIEIDESDFTVHDAWLEPGLSEHEERKNKESYLLFILDREKQEKFVNFIFKKLGVKEIYEYESHEADWIKITNNYEKMVHAYAVKVVTPKRAYFLSPEFTEGALWLDGNLVDEILK